MPDREKVIDGLTCRLECGCMNEDRCNPECPYLGDPRACYGLDEDALAMLKAQKPRVMTIDEVNAVPYAWVEDRKHFLMEPVLIMQAKEADGKINIAITTVYGSAILDTEAYNVQWRCWTSRPTDEQREAVKWE